MEPEQALLLIHMWRDYPHTVKREDISNIFAASLKLSPSFVAGFMDAWEYREVSGFGDADYETGFECGSCRPEIDLAQRDGISRN